MSEVTGMPVDRLDGRKKVTGTAIYSAEFRPEGMAYGVLVQSTIAKGRIRNIDTSKAEQAPGIVKVITSKNALLLHQPQGDGGTLVHLGEKDILPLQSDHIHYDGQHIAIVVGETFEQAEYAASLIHVDYSEEAPALDIEQHMGYAYKPSSFLGRKLQFERGDLETGIANAHTGITETYTTPVYHHNPMEPHATIAEWHGDKVTIYDSTQSVLGNKNAVAQQLGIRPENVHLVSLFVGGGFGCKGFTWPHSVLAPMAAKITGRPVKIVLDRQQMFTGNGRRARTIQKITLGASADGKLTAIKHNIITESSVVEEFTEPAGVATPMLYACDNLQVQHEIVRINRGTPCPMRAPGEAPGTYAFECAMDELAEKAGIDPVAFRLTNYADISPQDKKIWSAKNLRECYSMGADIIGWDIRKPKPRSMHDGRYLVGYGMATATYPANRSPASAKVQLHEDGHVVVICCSQDIGTGTYTIMAQIAADALGVDITKIESRLGDSTYPKGPGSGGSQTSASIGPPIRAAAIAVKEKVMQLAVNDTVSPLHGQVVENLRVQNGRVHLLNDTGRGEAYTNILRRHGLKMVEEEETTEVSTRENSGGDKKDEKEVKKKNQAVKDDENTDRKKYAFHSFGAQFVKVRVDPYLGVVKVTDCVSVMDVGKVLNLKTAKNQIMGGMIFAQGMALMEETAYDPKNARVVTRDLASYLVPVNADMPKFDVRFIGKPDPYISPVGSRGIGEIGITGTAAAIANAIYHATGKRVRSLPITPDKLI